MTNIHASLNPSQVYTSFKLSESPAGKEDVSEAHKQKVVNDTFDCVKCDYKFKTKTNYSQRTSL